jgi:hypothetical protein
MVKAPGMLAKTPRIIGSKYLEPPRILAKAPHNAETTYRRIMLKAPSKMPFDHFKPAMAFHKRRPKMKDDHIAYLPYA